MVVRERILSLSLSFALVAAKLWLTVLGSRSPTVSQGFAQAAFFL